MAKGPGAAPRIWRPYLQQSLPHPVLENSPRLHDLIRDGKLELSVSDALALTVEDNLDIVVQRYVVPFAETDILRTKSGQAARGFTGALYPSELNSGAIGAGVTKREEREAPATPEELRVEAAPSPLAPPALSIPRLVSASVGTASPAR